MPSGHQTVGLKNLFLQGKRRDFCHAVSLFYQLIRRDNAQAAADALPVGFIRRCRKIFRDSLLYLARSLISWGNNFPASSMILSKGIFPIGTPLPVHIVGAFRQKDVYNVLLFLGKTRTWIVPGAIVPHERDPERFVKESLIFRSAHETLHTRLLAAEKLEKHTIYLLIATMENNKTAKALLRQMPMTLSMADLYGRKMCYHYEADTLPVGETSSDDCEVGDLIYWPPMRSL
ncbi:MAG: cyclophilin-like fold protein [Oscillibacter sp.]|nr:cyclophilin-like fold protein [Oscillibacter sp.]